MVAITERERFVYKAKLAEQAERYDEMAEFMKEVAAMSSKEDAEHRELTVEERNLLSVAYKNAVGARRASWRIISSVEMKERARVNSANAPLADEYRSKVEAELNSICNTILNLLDDHLIPNSNTGESKVFYYKMKGDYYRYISEFSGEAEKQTAANNANDAYRQASEIAVSELPPTHPIRLGLALNFSVFHYEIRSNPDEACRMARQAFEDAIAELDNVPDDNYKDSTLIMQLLRDNLTLWTSDIQAPENDQ